VDTPLVIILDLAIILCAAASGLFWYLASRRHVRRISRSEVLDSRDINRLIVAFNAPSSSTAAPPSPPPPPVCSRPCA
jgi:hypothetical protein